MIISTKIGQTSFISEEGKRLNATVLDYSSCIVVGNHNWGLEGVGDGGDGGGGVGGGGCGGWGWRYF